MHYFTVVIPWVPREFQTEFHPTEQTGPFSTLTRGAFGTYAEAITWGRHSLAGTPYGVREVK